MYNQLLTFWQSLVNVFLSSSGTLFRIRPIWNVNGTTYQQDFLIAFDRVYLPIVLTWLSLIGLSVFLFYQIYKLIHAFVGGFYEDVC